MNDFQAGEKVAVHRPNAIFLGTVREANEDGRGHVVENLGGTCWLIDTWDLTALKADEPMFERGDHVLVTDARRTGVISGIEFRGNLFGYWLHLDDTGERVWVPAVILAPAEGGEVR